MSFIMYFSIKNMDKSLSLYLCIMLVKKILTKFKSEKHFCLSSGYQNVIIISMILQVFENEGCKNMLEYVRNYVRICKELCKNNRTSHFTEVLFFSIYSQLEFQTIQLENETMAQHTELKIFVVLLHISSFKERKCNLGRNKRKFLCLITDNVFLQMLFVFVLIFSLFCFLGVHSDFDVSMAVVSFLFSNELQ